MFWRPSPLMSRARHVGDSGVRISQTFCSKVLALISLGVLRAKDSCESQARYRPLAAGAHEMKRPGSWGFDPG